MIVCIAPGQSDKWKLLTEEKKSQDNSQGDEKIDTLLKLYDASSSWYTKEMILSIFASHYTKRQLQTMLHGLSVWRIDRARSHSNSIANGAIEPFTKKEAVVRYRLPQEKLDNFLDFTSSPRFLQDVAYGTKHLKLSSGEKLEIPGVIRTLVNTRVVKLYQAYCEEIGFIPLGKTSLHSILKVLICFIQTVITQTHAYILYSFCQAQGIQFLFFI